MEWSGVNAYVSIIGLAGKEADFVVPIMIKQTLPPVLASVMIAGIVSAGMSTVSGLMVVSAGGVSRDIYQKLINPEASDKTVLNLSRISIVVIGLIGIIIAINKPASIFELVRFAFGGLGVWVIAVILGMYWKKATTAGVLTGILIGELYYVALKLKWLDAAYSFQLDALIPAWCLGMIIAIIISYMTKPVEAAVIARHFD